MKLIGIGAGGHVKMLIETLAQNPAVELIGLLDTRADLVGTTVLGVPVIGGDELLPELREKGVTAAFIGVGSVGDLRPRREVFERLHASGFEVVSVLHGSAIISPSATLGEGATVLPLAIVNAGATIGRNALINSGAIVEHDCCLGDHVHIATGARLAGAVAVGDGAHVGIGATIREGIRVGAGAIVAAGAVVVRDVAEKAVVVGVPARAREGTQDAR